MTACVTLEPKRSPSLPRCFICQAVGPLDLRLVADMPVLLCGDCVECCVWRAEVLRRMSPLEEADE